MPPVRSSSSATPSVVAPDGIAIHFFDVPAARLVGVAEGRIPFGRFGIHRHLTLEQYTYIVSGRVTAITSSRTNGGETAVDLTQGELLLTLPGETLQFVNHDREVARVLFICSPPYAADDADTRVIEEHAPLNAKEAEATVERLLKLRADLNSEIDARLAGLSRVIEDPPL